jgi:DNA-directed RNA polymerase subunit RPC12/RpoP
MVVHFVYEVACTHCGLPILLHGAKPGQRAYSPGNQPIQTASTVIGCPHCKHAATYDQAEQLGTQETQQTTAMAYSTKLWCEEPNCGRFLPR